MLCPVCRADNAEGPSCRRCRADLSLLFALEQHQDRLLGDARRSAAQGDWAEALRALDAAAQIRDRPALRRWRAVCLCMMRDYSAAWDALRRARET